MRRRPILMMLLLLVTATVRSVAAPADDAGPLHVSIELADGSAYRKADLRLRFVFRNTAEPRLRIPAEAFSSAAFSLLNAKGQAVPAGESAAAPGIEGFEIDGYGTEERVIDITPWYPKLTAKLRTWTLSWRFGDWAVAPLTIRVIRPHDPARDRYAILDTDLGRMKWELLTGDAPQHVKQFVDLAREGYYDGQSFYRVVPGIIAEAGDPKGDGTGGWDRLMRPEIVDDLEVPMGLVGAQRREGSSMTSDRVFFITLSGAPQMVGKHTFFARVVDGLDVVARLSVAENHGNTGLKNAFLLVHPVVIRRVRIK